jgi:endonuclease III
MSTQRIVRQVLVYGRTQVAREAKQVATLRRTDINSWLFLIIFNQGIRAEDAWAAPVELRRRLGHLNMRRIASMPIARLRRAITSPRSLHRYVGKMPRWLKAAAMKIVREYGGDARNIWRECRTAGEVIERLLDFPGIGAKKAHMAARDLHENERPLRRWSEINVAVDVHVTRVFRRTGLTDRYSPIDVRAAAGRANPSYPGALDAPVFVVGRGWCHAGRPDCRGSLYQPRIPCPLVRSCPKIGVVHRRGT